jgi:hypothetical protein
MQLIFKFNSLKFRIIDKALVIFGFTLIAYYDETTNWCATTSNAISILL